MAVDDIVAERVEDAQRHRPLFVENREEALEVVVGLAAVGFDLNEQRLAELDRATNPLAHRWHGAFEAVRAHRECGRLGESHVGNGPR